MREPLTACDKAWDATDSFPRSHGTVDPARNCLQCARVQFLDFAILIRAIHVTPGHECVKITRNHEEIFLKNIFLENTFEKDYDIPLRLSLKR